MYNCSRVPQVYRITLGSADVQLMTASLKTSDTPRTPTATVIARRLSQYIIKSSITLKTLHLDFKILVTEDNTIRRKTLESFYITLHTIQPKINNKEEYMVIRRFLKFIYNVYSLATMYIVYFIHLNIVYVLRFCEHFKL